MAKSATGKRKPPTGKGAASRLKAAAAPKGCCVIETEGAPDRNIPNLTEAECDAIQTAHPDTATHWFQGDCA